MSKYIHQQQIRINTLDQQLAELQQENTVLKKALELACISIRKLNNTSKNIQPDFAEFYIADAKESVKND